MAVRKFERISQKTLAEASTPQEVADLLGFNLEQDFITDGETRYSHEVREMAERIYFAKIKSGESQPSMTECIRMAEVAVDALEAEGYRDLQKIGDGCSSMRRALDLRSAKMEQENLGDITGRLKEVLSRS